MSKKNDTKDKQLKWLMDNKDNIDIQSIYYDGFDGTPTLTIKIPDFDIAEESPFEEKNSCILYE